MWRPKKGILDKTYDVYKNGGWETFSVADLTSRSSPTTPPTSLRSRPTSRVRQSTGKITDAATNLGAIKNRIGLQQDFVKTLTDSLDRGIGQLVDADMNAESTRLQASADAAAAGHPGAVDRQRRQPEHPVAVPRLIALAS
jgi:flagellin